MRRHLSAVAEDCQGEDNGSMSMKKHPLRDLIQMADRSNLNSIEPIAEDQENETSPVY